MRGHPRSTIREAISSHDREWHALSFGRNMSLMNGTFRCIEAADRARRRSRAPVADLPKPVRYASRGFLARGRRYEA